MVQCIKCRYWAAMVGVFLIACGAAAATEDALSTIHNDIVGDYESVTHIDGDDFDALPPEERIVFDVRKNEEYAVSHIEGAIQVPADITVEQFETRYSALLKDKTVVFYCSVGRRSSQLAERVSETVAAQGATNAYNLIGGIFQWRNERRPLVSDAGPTDAVHPYNRYWGRLITDKSAIRFE